MYRIDLNYGHNLFLLILHVIKIFDEMHVEYQNILEIYTIYLHSFTFFPLLNYIHLIDLRDIYA